MNVPSPPELYKVPVMTTEDATNPQDGASDHPEPRPPVPFSEAMERVRAVAQRILDRVKKATEDTDVDATSLPPSEAPTALPSDPPTVEQPSLPPPPPDHAGFRPRVNSLRLSRVWCPSNVLPSGCLPWK